MERHIKRDEIYCKKPLSSFNESRLDIQITIKKFFLTRIKTSGKNIDFDDKRSTKVPFIKTKSYLIYMT